MISWKRNAISNWQASLQQVYSPSYFSLEVIKNSYMKITTVRVLLIISVMSNFPPPPKKKRGKKPLWTVYFRFPLKTNERLFLVTWHCQSESLKLGDRGDIYIYIPALTPCVGWVWSWFSLLLREVFLRVLRFSPLLKNQHFQIPIRSGTHGHV